MKFNELLAIAGGVILLYEFVGVIYKIIRPIKKTADAISKIEKLSTQVELAFEEIKVQNAKTELLMLIKDYPDEEGQIFALADYCFGHGINGWVRKTFEYWKKERGVQH